MHSRKVEQQLLSQDDHGKLEATPNARERRGLPVEHDDYAVTKLHGFVERCLFRVRRYLRAEVVLRIPGPAGALAANDFGMYCKTHAHMHTLRCELRS